MMKPQRIQISDPKQIGKILDFVHDQYFEKDNIRFEPISSVLEISFEKDKRDEKQLVSRKLLIIKGWRYPAALCVLRIRHVESFHVNAKEVFGLFNEIKYHDKDNTIVITSDIPITITIKVKDFGMEVEETGEIREKTYWSFF